MTRLAVGVASLLALSLLASCGLTSDIGETSASTAGPTTTNPAEQAVDEEGPETIGSDSSGSLLEEATDAVHPAIAALSFSERVDEVGRVEVSGEVWVLSKLPASTAQSFIDDGLAGPDLDPFGGEVLLVEGDVVIQSVPMSVFPPSFIEATDSMVYAGRNGDGGYPDSALVAIDLTSRHVSRLVIPKGDLPDPDPGPQWIRATDEQRDLFGRGEFGGIFP